MPSGQSTGAGYYGSGAGQDYYYDANYLRNKMLTDAITSGIGNITGTLEKVVLHKAELKQKFPEVQANALEKLKGDPDLRENLLAGPPELRKQFWWMVDSPENFLKKDVKRTPAQESALDTSFRRLIAPGTTELTTRETATAALEKTRAETEEKVSKQLDQNEFERALGALQRDSQGNVAQEDVFKLIPKAVKAYGPSILDSGHMTDLLRPDLAVRLKEAETPGTPAFRAQGYRKLLPELIKDFNPQTDTDMKQIMQLALSADPDNNIPPPTRLPPTTAVLEKKWRDVANGIAQQNANRETTAQAFNITKFFNENMTPDQKASYDPAAVAARFMKNGTFPEGFVMPKDLKDAALIERDTAQAKLYKVNADKEALKDPQFEQLLQNARTASENKDPNAKKYQDALYQYSKKKWPDYEWDKPGMWERLWGAVKSVGAPAAGMAGDVVKDAAKGTQAAGQTNPNLPPLVNQAMGAFQFGKENVSPAADILSRGISGTVAAPFKAASYELLPPKTHEALWNALQTPMSDVAGRAAGMVRAPAGQQPPPPPAAPQAGAPGGVPPGPPAAPPMPAPGQPPPVQPPSTPSAGPIASAAPPAGQEMGTGIQQEEPLPTVRTPMDFTPLPPGQQPIGTRPGTGGAGGGASWGPAPAGGMVPSKPEALLQMRDKHLEDLYGALQSGTLTSDQVLQVRRIALAYKKAKKNPQALMALLTAYGRTGEAA